VPHPSFMPAPVRYRFAYRPRPVAWAAACALLALASAARAQSGALDPTFGTGGIVKTPVGTLADVGRAVAIQADDRIVVAGYSTTNATGDDFSVARYLLNGTLDSSFNGTGKVITPVGPTNAIDRAFAVAVQDDQKIVVAGFSRNGGNEDFALVRYLPDGTLDGDFGSGGIVTTAIGTVNDEALAVAIQSDGRIVAAGYSHNGANRDLALARYLPDGTLDTTFSGDGKVSVPIGTGGNAGDDEARAIAIQPDGKIVIAGLSAFGSSEDMLVARFTTAGALDTTFGGGTGWKRIHFGLGNDDARALALQPDGMILIAGQARFGPGTQRHIGVARVDSTGTLDPGLNGTGILTTQIGTGSEADGIALFDSGRFVVAGKATNSGSNDWEVVRYNANGSLDTNFGGTGIVTTVVGTGPETAANGVAIQTDRKIVAAGASRTASDDNFTVARYLLDDCGNGTLDPGEQCDGGAVIGGDCCTDTCTVVSAGTVCRPAVDVCDITESCDGASGSCPSDQKLPDGDGDTVCDLIDICPVDPDPQQLDGDLDGLGDACDPCTNGVAVSTARLKLTKYTTGGGDDTFSFTGALDFASPPTLLPEAQGVRVIVEDEAGAPLFDVEVPGGAYDPLTRTGWTANKAGTSHTFRSHDAIDGVVNKVKLSTSGAHPDVVKFNVSGRGGSYATLPVDVPLSATMVLDAPTAATGLCGEVTFSGAPPLGCLFNTPGSTLGCK